MPLRTETHSQLVKVSESIDVFMCVGLKCSNSYTKSVSVITELICNFDSFVGVTIFMNVSVLSIFKYKIEENYLL